MPQTLDDLSLKFRSAVMAGDHALAGRLVEEYTVVLREVWMSLREEERAQSDLVDTAAELMGWARDLTVVQRALAAEQLAVIEKANHYSDGPAIRVRAGVDLRA